MRRAGLTVVEKKREDGIQDDDTQSIIKKRQVQSSELEMEEIKDSERI